MDKDKTPKELAIERVKNDPRLQPYHDLLIGIGENWLPTDCHWRAVATNKISDLLSYCEEVRAIRGE